MIRVMVVDDSSLVRKVLTDLIEQAGDMEVVATAPDPHAARELIKKLNPDVLTLDVEMPKMDGIDFLEKIMRLRPMPVVMVSSLTHEGNETTLRALELGAVDFITKPQIDVAEGLAEYVDDLHEKLRAANASTVSRRTKAPKAKVRPVSNAGRPSSEKIIVVGSSTGGTEAIRNLLSQLPKQSPGILITQHMPGGFTRSFAERLNRELDLTVAEGSEGQRVRPGCVYIAPGGYHMVLKRSGSDYVIGIEDSPPVNRHRPSVDVLFESAAKAAGKNAIAVILTGMGQDGAAGMLSLRHSGAYTLAQDEKSSVVFGMPKEAIERGAADHGTPLSKMGEAIVRAASEQGLATRL
ncbi:chemotaxis response regulator protein-glutamate methylesterase [Marinobacter sp. CHS3-4]|uniref:protein-glutamate methylesterase/protein-glutamine glutaminase n=1 Tax=Marinobacter sp. CHS3-4 TaxID=3045174 RepID=UPI0024B5D429|nr:chemotaxis response regulator protein-glutamate methylesterase [Marinobacter sp. CHS3-4]MDI9245620.1 chemotaxis response regulator protein-glutamate methylesterase [Marinobacter sp. CHS3-4]